MNEKIKSHIDKLFAEAPKTRRAMELKEEMTLNAVEKYEDLIGDGWKEDDAFLNVIGSIGDVTELFGELKEKNLLTMPEPERRKRAVMTAAAVGIYILAGVVFIVSMVINDVYFYMQPETGMLGFALAALICIPPTCMLIYAAHMYPVYHRKDENLVELYKEAARSAGREKAVRRSISLIIWLATLLTYFAVSFYTMRWEVTWLLFLAGACAQAIALLIFSLRRDD